MPRFQVPTLLRGFRGSEVPELWALVPSCTAKEAPTAPQHHEMSQRVSFSLFLSKKARTIRGVAANETEGGAKNLRADLASSALLRCSR
eukprot:scaffold37041_cov55-Phaeocystis_antarctica.AAC.3